MALKDFPGLPSLDRIQPADDVKIKKIVNLEAPEEDNDAATKQYVDNTLSETTINIHPAAFQPEDPTITWTLAQTGLTNSNGDTQIFTGNINMKNGSTLASAIGHASSSATDWEIFKVTSTGTATSLGGNSMNSSDTINEVIDNTTYSYCCRAQLVTTAIFRGLEITMS